MKTNLEIKEQWSNDGTFDLVKYNFIDDIKSITPNMELSFELKIENMDSSWIHRQNWVFWINKWFGFGIKMSSEASKYYIILSQLDGLGYHAGIRKQNPITFTKNWQKDFLSKILMIIFCKYFFSILF